MTKVLDYALNENLIIPVRQTVMAGPISAGAGSFLPASTASLSITSQNISTGINTLVVTAANGFGAYGASDLVGISTSNLTWSGLPASSGAWLGVNVSNGALTPIFTALTPIYQFGGTISVTNGQYTFDIAAMRMYLGNGTVANQVSVVFIGEVATNATTVTATIAYAYNGYYDSGYTNTLPSVGTTITKNSYIGTNVGINANLIFENITTEAGYLPGDQLFNGGIFTIPAAGVYVPFPIFTQRNIVGFTVGSNSSWSVTSKSGGGYVNITGANWKYKLIAKRGW